MTHRNSRGWLRALVLALPLALATAAAALSGVVNVNTASAEELSMLPGVGPARARAIVELRQQRGGFKRVEDLLEVKGIGDAGLAKLRPFIALEGKTTLQAD
jgi:competence protein ComEA